MSIQFYYSLWEYASGLKKKKKKCWYIYTTIEVIKNIYTKMYSIYTTDLIKSLEKMYSSE
jgi:hypothetical protein